MHGSLLSLIRRELIRPARASIPGADAYRFEHGLLREAAYLSLPKVERAALHERFAAWIDEDLHLRSSEADAIVGHHLDMSFRYRTELGLRDDELDRVGALAAEHLAAAGRHALRLGDVQAAHAQLLRASDLLSEGAPARIDLLPDLAVAEFQVGGISEALQTADRCVELAIGSELEGPRMHAIVLRSFWRMFADPERVDLDALLKTIEEAVNTFERRDEPLGVLRARNLLWEIWQWRGETDQQTAAAIAALEAAERVASAEDIDWAICNLGFALVDGADELGFATRRLQEWHDRISDRAGRIMLGAFLDYTLAMAGETVIASRAIDRVDLVGTAYVTEVPRLMWGRIALAALDYVAAERQFRAGWEVARAQGDNWFGPLAASELARALLEQGRLDEAWEVIDWLDRVRAAGDPEINIKKLAVLARLSAHKGDETAADRSSFEAVALTDGTGFLMFRAEALLDRAAVLRMIDRGEEVGPLVDEALELYAHKGCVPSPSRLLAATGSTVG